MNEVVNLLTSTDLTYDQIASRLGCSYNTVWRRAQILPKEYQENRRANNCAKLKWGSNNPMYGKFGANNPNYKGVVSDCKGYHMTLKPEWYTGRKNSKHIFLHHFVVCLEMRLPCIPKGWCVHHCDLDKLNNEFTNLVLMTVGDHMRLHQYINKCRTTISKESTLKWVEKNGTVFSRKDIV